MSLSGLFGIGGERENTPSSAVSGVRTPVSDPAATTVAALEMAKPSRPTSVAEAVLTAMRNASSSLRSAFSSLNPRSKAVFTTSGGFSGSSPRISGIAARIAALDDSYAVLRATVAVNTQTSTERASSSPIGLDLAMAPSTLSSAPLTLDVTSPEAPSTLSSSAALGLDVTTAQARSTLVSSGQLSAAPSSFAATVLAFSKDGATSTSAATLNGTFAALGEAAKATSLTIEINGTATLNAILPPHVRFRVVDQHGLALFNFDGKLRPNDEVYLGDDIGLTASFSLGTLVDAHSATVAVGSTRVAVDRNAAFNAPLTHRPRFDHGAIVAAGSFRVNGVTIPVNANDTLNTVLSRITSSDASVTASFGDDRVTLTSIGYSADDIVLAADTSGFLAATKLSGARTTRGRVRDDLRVLSKTTQFASVTSGAFSVNGVSISVNKESDSLSTVLQRINGSTAGVTARFDEESNKVVLSGRHNSKDLIVISGDSSGLAAAAKLATVNTVRGHLSEDRVPFANIADLSAVTAGTFIVDGQTIGVSPSDSVQSIISKINDSGARVVAAFDAAARVVTLTTTCFSEEAIPIGSDSSGLLAAAGISSDKTVLGKVGKEAQALAATAAFGDVTRGSFDVNGVSISVDPEHDSLELVLARINDAGAGVTASYHQATDRLLFVPATEGGVLVLDRDSCGFLDAAHLASGAAGTRFNPNGRFNGTGLDSPLFDPGLSVIGGSFTVDGVTVNVAANDTAAHVLDRIAASGAGVIATYDAATQKVSLARESGTAPIALGRDSSGFLHAVKLDHTARAGIEARLLSPFATSLASMHEYGSVQAGTLTVNAQPVEIDPITATINGVVAAIDAIGDVSASLDESTGAITIVSRQAGATVVVSDTSGLLATLGIGLGGAVPATAAPSSETGEAASAQLPTMEQEQAKQKLAVEQARSSLFFMTPMRPRAPEAAKLIKSMPVDQRKPRAARASASPPRPDTAPASPESLPVLTPGTLSASSELLRPLFDLFADGAMVRDRRERSTPGSWWRW